MKKIEEILGYTFNNSELLETALTHSSYKKEHNDEMECNERLEFLGDAFFDAIIGEELYRSFPDREEGFLSRTRAGIVCEDSLAKEAVRLGIGEYLMLGHGEDRNGGRQRKSILADSVEAIIGAVYLDGGFEEARKLVLDIFADVIEDVKQGRQAVTDYKTMLQEFLQRKGSVEIRYVPAGEKGPDHDKTFSVELHVNGRKVATGSGKTKKQAEQHAAEQAMKRKYNAI